MLALAVIILIQVPQDIEAIIERLRSDDPVIREQAEDELLKLGSDAVTKLRKWENDSDAEVRVRVKRVLEEFARRDRIRGVRPELKRLSLELKDISLAEAVKKVFEPFGMKSKVDDKLRETRVSLTLKDADFWQTMETFCSATKLEPPFASNFAEYEWRFEPKVTATEMRMADLGDVCIRCFPIQPCQDDTRDRYYVPVVAHLPPRSLPISATLENASLTDDQGRQRVMFQMDPEMNLGVRRGQRGVTIASLGNQRINRDGLADSRNFKMEGTLVLVYPHDIEVTELALTPGDQDIERRIGGSKLIMKKFDSNAQWCEIELKGKEVVEGDETVVFFELCDKDGNVMDQIGPPTLLKKILGIGCGLALESVGRPPPTKLVITRMIGRDEVRLPFVIKDIPVTQPKKK